MKHLSIIFVASIIQVFYLHGVHGSAKSKAAAGAKAKSLFDDDDDDMNSFGSGAFASSASSSSGPGSWTTMFSGPQTGGSVVTFSSSPSSKGEVYISKSESSSSGTKQIQSQVISAPSEADGVSAQAASFASDDEEDLPSNSRSLTNSNGAVKSRLLNLGGSGTNTRSGLLGLGLLGVL